MAFIVAHLNAGVTSIPPFPPFSPSLISLMVSLDIKHHVYLILEKEIFRGSSRDSNTGPFDHESGALTTELSLLPLKA